MKTAVFDQKTQTSWAPIVLGNRLFIDVANTTYDGEGALTDPFDTWESALTFLQLADGVSPDDALRLFKNGQGKSRHQFLRSLKTLRKTMQHLIDSVASGRKIPDTTVADINAVLRYANGGDRLAQMKSGYTMVKDYDSFSPNLILGAIGRSAADFLVNDQHDRLKRCAEEACPLYFYDTSKNGRRRWCRMDVCGNRAKVSAYYHRHKDE